MLQECWRPAFHRRHFTSIRQLQAEADSSLITYNHRRRNHGDYMSGRTPQEILDNHKRTRQHDNHQPQGPSVTSTLGPEGQSPPMSPWPRTPSQAGTDAEPAEVPLHGRLAEFRTALRQEIEAAKRASNAGAVPLVNGRRIGQLGSAYQYLFEVENAVNLLGDAPGDLSVPGGRSHEVTIIAILGLNVTLSVNTDLGAFVPSARLVSNLAHLMRKLIERIEFLRDVPNEAGERILGDREVDGGPWPIEDPELPSAPT